MCLKPLQNTKFQKIAHNVLKVFTKHLKYNEKYILLEVQLLHAFI